MTHRSATPPNPPSRRPAIRFGRATLAPLMLAVMLSGCIGGGKPVKNLLRLAPAAYPAAGRDRVLTADNTVLVAAPSVPRLLATTRVAVVNGPTGIAYLKDSAWVDLPSVLFTRTVTDVISARSDRFALPAREGMGMPGVRIAGDLSMLGLDAARGEAVIIYDAILTDPNAGKVINRRFEYRAPTSLASPAQAGAALNAGVNQIAGQIADWVTAH